MLVETTTMTSQRSRPVAIVDDDELMRGALQGLLKAAGLPMGGAPRLRRSEGEELPTDVKEFLKRVDSATGTRTDPRTFGKLYGTGHESPRGHATDVVEYLQAVGASPDKIKEYGGQ